MEIKITRSFAALLAILFVSLTIRMNLLGVHRMHMDECLYSSYAIRMVTHGDIGMNGGLQVDKPPVMFYILALSFLVNGITENAARMPGIFMSLFLVFFVHGIVLRIFKNSYTALLAAAFTGFSVYNAAFSATAFQDMPMTMFFVVSLCMAYDRRPAASSVFYWLSVMSKPMTLFLFPLYASFIFIYAGGIKGIKNDFWQYLKGALYVTVPVILWSAFLANPRFGIFLFFVTQQPEAMGISASFIQRMLTWFSMSGFILNSYYFLVMAPLLAVAAAVIYTVKKDTENLKAGLFVFFAVIYCFAIFSLLKFRQYDRYLLIIQPFLSMMLAWGFVSLIDTVKNRNLRPALAAVLITAFLLPALHIQESGYKGGALFDRSDGFEKAAAFLKKYESRDNEIRYMGGTLSWYGYFYLAESGFSSALPYYSAESILKEKSNGRVFIVLDTSETEKNEMEMIAKKCRMVFSAPGNYGEFLIYEL